MHACRFGPAENWFGFVEVRRCDVCGPINHSILQRRGQYCHAQHMVLKHHSSSGSCCCRRFLVAASHVL